MDFLRSNPMPKAVVVFDIDGVVRDVAGSYRRALADTVESFTQGCYRPTPEDIDDLKAEGCWNNDWEASQELIHRFLQAHSEDQTFTVPPFDEIVAFFQSKYRGVNFSGYIKDEPLLMGQAFLTHLTQQGLGWGFFSGATRISASYILEQRLGLEQPILVAMEEAPGKPNPTGLFLTLERLAIREGFDWNPAITMPYPILYVGDTVADMQTIEQAKGLYPLQHWLAIGVIPPHVKDRVAYRQLLQQRGAAVVLEAVEQLDPFQILQQCR